MITEPERPAWVRNSAHAHWYAVGGVCMGAFMIQVDASISGLSGAGLPPTIVAALFLVTAAAVPLFLVRERRFRWPLVAPSLLRIRVVAVGFVGTFTSYLLLYAPLVLVPQLFVPLGITESRVGPMLAALPLGFVLATVAINSALPKSNSTRLLTGATLAIGAVSVLALRPLDVTVTVIGLALLGIGLGIFVPANNATVMGGVPHEETGMGSGLISMIRNMGTAVGVALVTLALNTAGHDSRRQVDGRSGPAYTSELDAAHLALGILTAAAAVTLLTAFALRSALKPT